MFDQMYSLVDKVKIIISVYTTISSFLLIQPGMEGRVRPSTTRVGNTEYRPPRPRIQLVHTLLLTVFNII